MADASPNLPSPDESPSRKERPSPNSSDALHRAVGALRAMLTAREDDHDRSPEDSETASGPDAS